MSEQFPLISGHPSIDLVNTEVVRRGIRHDLLVTESDLKHWLTTMQETRNLVGVQIGDRLSLDILHSVRELRTVLRNGLEQIAGGQSLESNWRLHLENLIERAPFSYKIAHGHLVAIPVGKPADAVASLVSFDALQLLASGDLFNLHHCANPDCVLLFLDATGRRKWCSMQICGNRTKVARHQSRRAMK